VGPLLASRPASRQKRDGEQSKGFKTVPCLPSNRQSNRSIDLRGRENQGLSLEISEAASVESFDNAAPFSEPTSLFLGNPPVFSLCFEKSQVEGLKPGKPCTSVLLPPSDLRQMALGSNVTKIAGPKFCVARFPSTFSPRTRRSRQDGAMGGAPPIPPTPVSKLELNVFLRGVLLALNSTR